MRSPVILYVDDELGCLTGLESLLKLHGYDVLISTSPDEALKLFSSCPVDAVVLDYQMPEMCGDVLAARMKQINSDIPIMLLSAHDSLARNALEHVNMFVSKSELPQAFVAAVEALLNTRERFFSRWLREWRQRTAA